MTKMAGAVAALTLATACASTEKYETTLDRWVGVSVDKLVLEWGPPDSEFTLADGTSVIEYRREETTGGGSYATTETHVDIFSGNLVQTPVTKTRPIYQQWCRTRFMVSADRVVSSYSFEGNACRA